MHRSILIVGILFASVLPAGCLAPEGPPPAPVTAEQEVEPGDDPMVSVDTLLPAPPDFALARIDTDAYPLPSYAKYLDGVRICLDPGHGGLAHRRGYKRGPTGVREAEMNLRVAQYLRDFLEHVGAEVLLTREADEDSTLKARAEIANAWGADLFISCHHNAMSKPEPNYTTVWYHGAIDDRPANLDLARYLCQGLLDGLALDQHATVPLKSDQLMYESGFGILRNARVTAALVESSFFTHHEEEQRLRDPDYNLQEAYGLFLALARYAADGLPRAALVEPAEAVAGAGEQLTFALDDGLRGRKAWGHDRQMIYTDSIAVRVDGQLVPHSFTNEGYVLTADLPEDLAPGTHTVTVHFQNMYKNSVLNPFLAIEVQ